jgi:hypothetical protein
MSFTLLDWSGFARLMWRSRNGNPHVLGVFGVISALTFIESYIVAWRKPCFASVLVMAMHDLVKRPTW